jgi:hypothetical protein
MLAFSLAGCGDGAGGGGSTDPVGPPEPPRTGTVTYSGTNGGETYTLEITPNPARAIAAGRAAYEPQNGDFYKLTVGVKVSTGTITNVNVEVTITFELTPSVAGAAQFFVKVEIDNNNTGIILEITGTIITYDDGETDPVPEELMPFLVIDGWTWSCFADRVNGGTSTSKITQGTGNDSDKITFNGHLTATTPNGEWDPYGYASLTARPNEENLIALKNGYGISFKTKGDGKTYYVLFVTSDVTDYDFHQYKFTPSGTEQTVTILYDELVQVGWGEPVDFNKSNIIGVDFQPHSGITELGDYSVTVWDLKPVDVVVSFTGPTEKIIPITRNITNNLSKSGEGSITLGINEDFSSYEWYIGTTKAAEGKNVTLQANLAAFTVGDNWITIVVYEGTGTGAIPYSSEFIVHVAN